MGEEEACLPSLQTCSLPVPQWRHEWDDSCSHVLSSSVSMNRCVIERCRLKNCVGVTHMGRGVGLCETDMLPPVCVEETGQVFFNSMNSFQSQLKN